MSCLVFLPRDRYATRVGAKVQDLLREALDGGAAEHTVQVSESALARLHVVVRPRPGEELREGDQTELEAAVAQAVRSWDDDVLDAARARLGEAGGRPCCGGGPAVSPGNTARTFPPGAPSRTFSEWRTSSARSTPPRMSRHPSSPRPCSRCARLSTVSRGRGV